MTPIEQAMARAERGLDWSRPCLIWIADYLRDVTGQDPAADWRAIRWDEATAKGQLARLAAKGRGVTAVERALDVIARRDGWEPAEGPQQGAVMIGVYNAQPLMRSDLPDRIAGDVAGVEAVREGLIGVPSIFDGQKRWIVSNDGRGWTSIALQPYRMWSVPCACF